MQKLNLQKFLIPAKIPKLQKMLLIKKYSDSKAWKSLGAFTAIILAAQPVDHFVEYVVKKFVRPQMARIVNITTNNSHQIRMDKFAQQQAEEKSQKII